MKKHTGLLTLCTALCLLLSACGGAAPSQEPPPAPEPEAQADPNLDTRPLVIAIQDEVGGLDIQQIASVNLVHSLLYEPLITYSADLSQFYPSFAESFAVTDKYLEFVLPAGAKFSNGDPLDAEAVKASMERFLRVSEYADSLDAVKSIEVVDERTVRFHLSKPAPNVLSGLASLYGGIVNAEAAASGGDFDFNRNPIGNGMYYLEEWSPGDHITLKRNPYFHTSIPMLENQSAPLFETVIVRFIGKDDDRVSEFENGSVDILCDVPPVQAAAFRDDGGCELYSYLRPGVSYLNLQTEKGILADFSIRQALSCAIDRKALVEALGGAGAPAYGFISPSQFCYSEDKENKFAIEFAYDPEYAQKILAQSGWREKNFEGILKKGNMKLQLEMMIPSDSTSFKTVAPLLEEQFAAIGVKVQILEYESGYIKELMREDEYTIGSRSVRYVDPDALRYCFSSDSGDLWSDDELTALFRKARDTAEPEARTNAYAAVSERLSQVCKGIPLFVERCFIASKSDVSGLFVTSDGRIYLNDVVKR